jgi:predicted transcriptional regulator
MARPEGSGLTDHELTIMQIVWDDSPLSVQDIVDCFPRKPKPAYSSLLTAVRALEKKGYLTHTKEGKAHLYTPKIAKESYAKVALRRVLQGVFGGSTFDAAVSLIKEEDLSKSEIADLKALLEDL